MPKDAIAKPHARSFCVSTTRKDRFALVSPSMHRDIVNHSPDSPAASGERWEKTVPALGQSPQSHQTLVVVEKHPADGGEPDDDGDRDRKCADANVARGLPFGFVLGDFTIPLLVLAIAHRLPPHPQKV